MLCIYLSQSLPHELVYAKVTGYPYWPAKVMEMKPDGCDVRFFGPGHHRCDNVIILLVMLMLLQFRTTHTHAHTHTDIHTPVLTSHPEQLISFAFSSIEFLE